MEDSSVLSQAIMDTIMQTHKIENSTAKKIEGYLKKRIDKLLEEDDGTPARMEKCK